MPPEQAEGKLEWIDHRSDVYSLGAILYEILALERPIEGDTVHKVLLNVSDGKITPPEQRTPGRHIPKELSAVVMKAMSTNRRKRYQSVMDLAQDIKRFLEGRSVSAKEDTFAESVVKLVKRNKGVSIATGIAAAVVLVGVLVAFVTITAEKNEAIRQKSIAERKEKEATDARDAQRSTALNASRRAAEQAARAAEEGRFAEAEIRADAAAELAPWGPWGLYAKGAIAWGRKDLPGAEQLLKKALEAELGEAVVRNLLVRVQSALGKGRDAASLLKKLDQIEKWEELLAAADVLYEVEDYRRAKALYEAALAKMKTDPKVTPDKPEWAREWLGNAEAWIKCEGFRESLKKLRAEEQAGRVREKLAELHGKSVAFGSEIREGVLRGVQFANPREVTYVQPLLGLRLERLNINFSRVSDLRALRGMPLKRLDLENTNVRDLLPLKGMPLEYLAIVNAPRVQDISPLEGIPLRHLSMVGTAVSDIGPLKGMLLVSLTLPQRRLDLSVLKGMPLEYLVCGPVDDLSPLSGLPLKRLNLWLHLGSTTGLSPLRGLALEDLTLSGFRGSDLHPLRGMPLKNFSCDSPNVSDLSPLEGMPLENLTVAGAKVSDLTPLKGMRLTSVCIYRTLVTDLSPLKGMPVRSLVAFDTQVEDLSPLGGMPLVNLDLQNTKVKDLTPLRGMHTLTSLRCTNTQVTDLSPLEGMSLQGIGFTPKNITKGIEVLRTMKSLTQISDGTRNFTPAEFWKKYDAGEFK